MSSENFPIAPDEIAPSLAYYLDFASYEVNPASSLKLSQAASVSALTWASVHYQILHVDPDAGPGLPEPHLQAQPELAPQTMAQKVLSFILSPRGFASAGDVFIDTFFPYLDGKRPVPAVSAELRTFSINQAAGNALMFSKVEIDLLKPGEVSATDKLIREKDAPDNLLTTRFAPHKKPVVEIQASIDEPIEVVISKYPVGEAGAKEFIEILQSAGPESLDDRDNRELAMIDRLPPALQLAYLEI